MILYSILAQHGASIEQFILFVVLWIAGLILVVIAASRAI